MGSSSRKASGPAARSGPETRAQRRLGSVLYLAGSRAWDGGPRQKTEDRDTSADGQIALLRVVHCRRRQSWMRRCSMLTRSRGGLCTRTSLSSPGVGKLGGRDAGVRRICVWRRGCLCFSRACGCVQRAREGRIEYVSTGGGLERAGGGGRVRMGRNCKGDADGMGWEGRLCSRESSTGRDSRADDGTQTRRVSQRVSHQCSGSHRPSISSQPAAITSALAIFLRLTPMPIDLRSPRIDDRPRAHPPHSQSRSAHAGYPRGARLARARRSVAVETRSAAVLRLTRPSAMCMQPRVPPGHTPSLLALSLTSAQTPASCSSWLVDTQ